MQGWNEGMWMKPAAPYSAYDSTAKLGTYQNIGEWGGDNLESENVATNSSSKRHT